MSLERFEVEQIKADLPIDTKILINALKNKIIELSTSLSYEDPNWDKGDFVDRYFESVTDIGNKEL